VQFGQDNGHGRKVTFPRFLAIFDTMSTYIAHPVDEAQERAIRAFLEALQIPYEAEIQPADDTAHLLSTPANAERLTTAIAEEGLGKGQSVSLDDIWK
jgi:hypothetical protein